MAAAASAEQATANTFYVSTAIDYPSGPPHLGHAYEKTVADAIARWKRVTGSEVFFSTGLDEHGMKIQRKAQGKGVEPQQWCDDMAVIFKQMSDSWNVSYDRFIRTTDPDHTVASQEMFSRLKAKGDIYLDKYEGPYCTDCERFYVEKDLVDGECPVHKGIKLDIIKEDSYFFKMSKYGEALLKHMDENPTCIAPKNYFDDIYNRVKSEGLRDLSVTRTSFTWGIPVPGEEKHIMYVWLDALTNYLTSAGFPNGEWKKWWPANVHVIGKDITWFHCVIWPCFLLAAEIPLPKQVYVHGFVTTMSGAKMSKSAGSVVDPIQMAELYSAEALRYVLLRAITAGEDGQFSEGLMVQRFNDELANKWGNLLHRATGFNAKSFNGVVPNRGTDTDAETELQTKVAAKLVEIKEKFDNFEWHKGLAEAAALVDIADKYVNDCQPWAVVGTDPARAETINYYTLDLNRIVAIVYRAALPGASEKAMKKLGYAEPSYSWADARFGLLPTGQALTVGEVLFSKLEVKKIEVPPLEYKKVAQTSLISAIVEIKDIKVQKKTGPLEKEKKEIVKKLNVEELRNHPLTKRYQELFAEGKIDKGEKISTVNLFDYLDKKAKSLPGINTLVDAYNIKSTVNCLVMGAYDRKGITGGIRLVEATGEEKFIPAGSKDTEKITPGELVYVDDSNDVVTRIFSKQAEYTKVDPETTHVAMCIQGNEQITVDELREKAKETAEYIIKFTGGTYNIVFCG